MKIRINETQDSDFCTRHQLYVDEKQVASIGPLCECPEDAIIGRDLIDGNDIIKYILMGYDAAKRGEEIQIEKTSIEE